MQDRPSLEQLLKAVSGFLGTLDDTFPGGSRKIMSSQQMFHARVAGNVMALVRREMELAPALDLRERTRLLTLLALDDTHQDLFELNKIFAQRIASGALTLQMPLVRTHLIETTLGKLSIDQPNYAGFRRASRDL
ncbi:MAG: hypothetical protein HAW65_02765 [Alphaproteobacteria bacterium]|nr:hypothetical protein [Alphaproteobacteria bacterium]